MNTAPAVIVKKGGFFAALVRGIFGTIMVVLLCGTAITLYGMRIADHVVQALPNWQQALPPAVASALADKPAVDYQNSVQVATKVERRGTDDSDGVVRIEVTNTGKEIVTLMTMRVVVDDQSGEPAVQFPVHVASPFMMCNEWPGKLWPGKTRVLTRHIRNIVGEPKVTYEINDLQLWKDMPRNVNAPRPAEATGSVAAVPTLPGQPPAEAQPGDQSKAVPAERKVARTSERDKGQDQD